MSALAAPTRSEPGELRVSPLINQFLERVVSDLPYDDVTGRLQRRQYVIDRLKLEFSKDAARLAAKFANEDAGELLDAATAGEWIRHNCRTSRSVAYDCINVGEQLHRLPKSTDALTTGAIGFAHLSVIARTSSALAESTPESTFVEDDLVWLEAGSRLRGGGLHGRGVGVQGDATAAPLREDRRAQADNACSHHADAFCPRNHGTAVLRDE